MLKTKIIAADLQNLTDARYFAAWLVEYISYDLSHPNIDLVKIKEIMDWVEGPINIARYSGLEQKSDIIAQLEALSIDHIILGPFANKELVDSDWQIIQTVLLDDNVVILDSGRTYIFQSDQSFSKLSQSLKDSLRQLCSENKVYLDCEFNSSDVDDILLLGVEGLVLRGGEEEKVGVKTYEVLDEIFEALEL